MKRQNNRSGSATAGSRGYTTEFGDQTREWNTHTQKKTFIFSSGELERTHKRQSQSGRALFVLWNLLIQLSDPVACRFSFWLPHLAHFSQRSLDGTVGSGSVVRGQCFGQFGSAAVPKYGRDYRSIYFPVCFRVFAEQSTVRTASSTNSPHRTRRTFASRSAFISRFCFVCLFDCHTIG